MREFSCRSDRDPFTSGPGRRGAPEVLWSQSRDISTVKCPNGVKRTCPCWVTCAASPNLICKLAVAISVQVALRWRGRRDVDGPNRQSELSQLLRNAGIKTPTCAILWREYADAAAVAQHIRVVKQIDDVEAERRRL